MAANLVAAAILNGLTFVLHAVGLVMLTRVMVLLAGPGTAGGYRRKLNAVLVVATGLLLLLCVEMAIWASFLVWVRAFPDFGTAFYFSTSAFATIGFGDVAPTPDWRLLASMEGVTGFLVIGWTAAYLVASGIRFGPFEREMHF